MKRVLAGLVLLLPAVAGAALDLPQATIYRLRNGLELIVLEEHTLPVVSTQMLYRTGARDEENGRTGLAHYLEHMAFRATENFPDTQVVSRIYAAGGEWHGYTWIDQTTYFETVPKEHLDLVLRIQADRMGRLEIPEDEVEAERGSVLAELHGYENDPATVLNDAAVYASLLAHPYRNNTIGWESDVERIDRRDLVRFYRAHYKPSNAVLVVVGDVDTADVRKRVTQLFGDYPASAPTPLPRTIEPPQFGERRVTLQGAGAANWFQLVYRAPAAGSADFPAFLLVQEILAGGDGVNFAQGLGGTAVREGSLLHGVTDDIETWLPPAAQPYIFTISGSVPAKADLSALEEEIEARIAVLRDEAMSDKRVDVARRRVLSELVFDVETTEDAAHQLAFYSGLNALGAFLRLPEAIGQVRPEQIREVAARYLQAHQRTVAWYRAGPPLAAAPIETSPVVEPLPESPPPAADAKARPTPPPPPVVARLYNGLPAIVQRIPLSPACYVRVLVPAASLEIAGSASTDALAWDMTALGIRSTAKDLGDAIGTAHTALAGARIGARSAPDEGTSPEARLEYAFEELLDMQPPKKPPPIGPALVVAVGDLDVGKTLNLLETSLGEMKPVERARTPKLRLKQKELRVQLTHPIAQAQLGYVVPAPAPSERNALAWRLLLYVLTHGYEGRLGREAISKRGLVYYVDGQYRSDGERAFVSLSIGVDPKKLEAMEALLREQIALLVTQPPDEAEVAEAKQHLVGRLRSAAVSNEEISERIALEWMWYGRLLEPGELEKSLSEVTVRDVAAIARDFADGAYAVVSN
jgi:zinc protease